MISHDFEGKLFIPLMLRNIQDAVSLFWSGGVRGGGQGGGKGVLFMSAPEKPPHVTVSKQRSSIHSRPKNKGELNCLLASSSVTHRFTVCSLSVYCLCVRASVCVRVQSMTVFGFTENLCRARPSNETPLRSAWTQSP